MGFLTGIITQHLTQNETYEQEHKFLDNWELRREALSGDWEARKEALSGILEE